MRKVFNFFKAAVFGGAMVALFTVGPLIAYWPKNSDPPAWLVLGLGALVVAALVVALVDWFDDNYLGL